MIVEHNVDEKSNQSNVHAKGKKMKRFLDLRFVQEIANQSNTCKERKHLRFEAYLVWLQRQYGIIIAVYFDNLMIKIAEHIVQEISNQSNMCKERKHIRFEMYLVWLLRQCGIIAVYFEKEFLWTIAH